MTSAPSAGTGNVADLVATAARTGPDHPALVDLASGRTLTWADLDAAVTAQARDLVAAGAHPGDRVAVRLPAGPEYAAAVFGALRAGLVVVPLAPGAADREVTRVLTDSGALLLVGEGPADVPVRAPVLDTTPGTPLDSTGGGEDVAVLAYTSGTSGVARGAMLSHRALLANLAQCAELRPAPVTAADRVLLALPLFHVYGLGPGLFQVAAAGATGVLVDRFDPAQAVRAVREHRITTLVGVPPMYQALLALPDTDLRAELATVRLCTSGAAPLDPVVLAEWQRVTGLPLHEGYGLTETGPVLTSTLVSGQPKAGSVGRALPGVELRLVDSDGDALGDDPLEEAAGTGLVAARGANLFSGYWPDAAHGPAADGWFRTGDVGYFDADGDLHLVDRAGDLIIVNGFNVYPSEVEQVLAELPGVVEAAAVGVSDPRTGEAVKVVLVLADGAEVTEADVVDHCAARLAKFKVPTAVEFADVLPHSPTGKLARRRLRAG
jgi:long-chain acyl-CoA synthetase